MKKRRTVKWVMNVWRLYLVIALCFDLYYNYFRYIIYKDVPKEIKDGAAFASAASTAAQLIALTILLLW